MDQVTGFETSSAAISAQGLGKNNSTSLWVCPKPFIFKPCLYYLSYVLSMNLTQVKPGVKTQSSDCWVDQTAYLQWSQVCVCVCLCCVSWLQCFTLCLPLLWCPRVSPAAYLQPVSPDLWPSSPDSLHLHPSTCTGLATPEVTMPFHILTPSLNVFNVSDFGDQTKPAHSVSALCPSSPDYGSGTIDRHSVRLFIIWPFLFSGDLRLFLRPSCPSVHLSLLNCSCDPLFDVFDSSNEAGDI